MTTTGEYLVSISTLATGSALDHFLNIETGGGTWPTETVLVDWATIALPAEQDMSLAADSDLKLLADDSVDVDSDGTLVVSDGDELEID
jgi:hypothetical protein